MAIIHLLPKLPLADGLAAPSIYRRIGRVTVEILIRVQIILAVHYSIPTGNVFGIIGCGAVILPPTGAAFGFLNLGFFFPPPTSPLSDVNPLLTAVGDPLLINAAITHAP